MSSNKKIKILYVFKENNTYMWKWQRHYIFDDLYQNNVEVEVINPLLYTDYCQTNEEVLKKIKKTSYDLVMTPHNEDVLYISTLKDINRAGIKTMLFCPDSLLIPFNYKNVCKYYDLVWITSPKTASLYKRWDANAIYLPYAANPKYYNPDYENEINKVCFIGTPHSNRSKIINILLDSKVFTVVYMEKNKNKEFKKNNYLMKDNVNSALRMIRYDIGRKLLLSNILYKLRGAVNMQVDSDFLEIKQPVTFEELPIVYSQYALSLATTAALYSSELKKPVDFLLLRNFEIPMSGGLQICPYSDEMEACFDDKKEIIYYNDNEEFLEKVRFYLKPENHSLRVKMKNAARRRAEREHTWFMRFKKIFSELGIKI